MKFETTKIKNNIVNNFDKIFKKGKLSGDEIHNKPIRITVIIVDVLRYFSTVNEAFIKISVNKTLNNKK